MITRTLHQDIDEILPGVIADRRHLHENPELGFQEFKTAEFVRQRLESLGVEDIRTGIAVTGVTGLIRGTADGPGRNVLLRADMDALPITEENEVDYRSQTEGVMHACGHDAHTAILLGVARILTDRRDQFSGTVKLCFQPAEETPPGGAIRMIAEGVLENPMVDAVIGLHMSSAEPTGRIILGGGPAMGGGDLFQVEVQGQGGHAASPHESVDPVAIGAQIVTALQTLVSRETDPMDTVVVTVGMFQGGDAFNVIPDTATFGGTVRAFDMDKLDEVNRRIEEIASGIAASMGGSATVTIHRGYPPTINDGAVSELVRQAATDAVGEENVGTIEPKLGGEDFSHYLRVKPGTFFFVGSRNEEEGIVHGHHHPRFDIDEDSLATGMLAMTTSVLAYLNQDQMENTNE
jgi:amidohydrolase